VLSLTVAAVLDGDVGVAIMRSLSMLPTTAAVVATVAALTSMVPTLPARRADDLLLLSLLVEANARATPAKVSIAVADRAIIMQHASSTGRREVGMGDWDRDLPLPPPSSSPCDDDADRPLLLAAATILSLASSCRVKTQPKVNSPCFC
jgi:hypothetical protein